jgi:DNA uptake protein ComE-like DNA-binding protein
MIKWNKYILLIAFSLGSFLSFAQKEKLEKESTKIIENRIEYLLQSLEAEEVDLTTLFDQLYFYLENPINLNDATKEELIDLQLLNDFQIQALLYYQSKNRGFASVYELRTIDGFEPEIIQQILPFINVQPIVSKRKIRPKNVLKYGRHELIVRHVRTLPTSVGYNEVSDSILAANANAKYLGSPDRVYARYRFRYSKTISAGITGEKDPGEEFASGSQQNGFDFYSAHLFLQNIGPIDKIAIGDYQLQMGQGLTIWSGFGFRKSPTQTVNIKRYAQQIRAYTSTDENNFLRGAAAVLGTDKLKLTIAYSQKQIDGNLNLQLDTLTGEKTSSFSSFQASGMHRLPSELIDKDAIEEKIIAARLGLDLKGFQIGVLGVQSEYDQTLDRALTYYQFHEFEGDKLTNIGVDYQWTLGKFHFFGETAQSIGGGNATLNGVLMNLDSRLKMSVLQRYYAKDYRSQFANAFGEKNGVLNENGIYFGVEMYPNKKVIFNAFYDVYSFPWLSFRADAPSGGQEFSGQLTIKPKRGQEVILLYRHETKERNAPIEETTVTNVLSDEKSSRYRFQFSANITDWVGFRTRIEVRQFEHAPKSLSIGYLYYNDLYFNMLDDKLTLKIRYALFDAPDYNARIYAYEHDLLYQFNVPAYYLTGSRIYGVVRYKILEGLTLNFKIGQTFLADRDYFGSGKDLIETRTRAEIKSQIIWKF